MKTYASSQKGRIAEKELSLRVKIGLTFVVGILFLVFVFDNLDWPKTPLIFIPLIILYVSILIYYYSKSPLFR